MGNKLPTLTPSGNTDSSGEIMIKAYLYFAVSEKTQTFFYGDSIASLKYIISENDDDISVIDAIKETLMLMYNRYFRDTEVTVAISDDDINIKVIQIQVSSIDSNDEVIELDQSVEIENGTIRYLDNHILDLYKGK